MDGILDVAREGRGHGLGGECIGLGFEIVRLGSKCHGALRVLWGSASTSPDRFGHGGRSQQASDQDRPIAGGLCRRRWQPFSDRNGANHRVDGLRPKCSCPPEGDERDGQADGALGIRLESPVQRRAQLIRLAVEPAKPEHHLGTHQRTLGLKGEIEVIAKVRCSKALRVAHVHEPIARVLPDRLQHVIPRLFRGLGDDERAVHQACQAVQRIHPVRRGAVCDRHDVGRRVEAPGGSEHREPGQQAPIVIREQVPAPVDESSQRLLARERPSPASGEQAETIAQASCDLTDGEDGHPGRRKLDGQRDSVQPPADVQDRGRVVRRHSERRHDRLRAVGKQPHRLAGGDVFELAVGIGQTQRRDLEDHLSLQPQCLAAGGQDGERRVALEQPLREVPSGADDVLAVVEQHEQRLGAHEVQQGVDDLSSGLFAHAKSARHLHRHQFRIADGRKLGEPDAVRKLVQQRPRRLRHQARLSGSSHANQGHQPLLERQVAQFL